MYYSPAIILNDMGKIKILFLTGDLNYTDGVSSHLLNLMTELTKDDELELHLMYSGGQALEKFKNTKVRISLNKNLSHDSRSFINFSKAFFEVRKYLKDHEINITHSHNHYAANIAGRAAKNLWINTVQTIHGIIPDIGKLKHFYAGKFILLNKKNHDYFIRKNIAEEKDIYNVRQGIPENLYSEKKLFRSEPDGNIPKILFASRLIDGKGADIFIKASAIVRKNFTGKLRFVMAGSGEMENDLIKLSTELNTEIEFAGSVEDITPLMKSADIFVNATLMQSEGFPMSVAEAAFSGCLIISSKAEWLEEVFTDRQDGFTFEKNDYKNLSEKILTALQDRDQSQNFAHTFQTKAKQLFCISEFAEKHKIIYKECLQIN